LQTQLRSFILWWD